MAMHEPDLNSQAFWNEFMRRPDAKAAYSAERRLQEKKQRWLSARNEIEERGRRRIAVADALEDAPADLKKLIAPMFHIRVVEQYLWMVLEECQKYKSSFNDKLRDERTLQQLTKLREHFQAGGEDRMEELESEWFSICDMVAQEEEAKKEVKPVDIDIHTLKQVLEFGQECKIQGNNKFKEGLYEEALHIYSQGDDVMKKWKVDKHLKNEHKWLKDYHLACLKNKSQAALKLELWQTALDAADGALALDAEDHKAWYRRVQALKGLGKFDESEEALAKLEDVAQWCPDRRRILRDCEAERKRLHYARIKHKQGTKNMLESAFEAGVFSQDREKELEDARRQQEEEVTQTKQAAKTERRKAVEPIRPLTRDIHLTAALAGDLIDALSDAYAQKPFQARVHKCARDSGYERTIFLVRLKGVAFEIQKPILEKWGFEGSEHGVREMTAAIREHAGADGKGMPDWLKKKQDRCLNLLYGGEEGGMLDVLTS